MEQPTNSSGLITASGIVSAGPAVLCTLMIVGGSATSTVTIYDNASAASGTVLAQFSVAAATTWSQDMYVQAEKGLYAAVTGTGVGAIAHFYRSG